MNTIAEKIGEQAAVLRAHFDASTTDVKQLLALASEAEVADTEAAQALLDVVSDIGRAAQAREGEIVLFLAQVERIKASKRGSLAPWIAQNLDVTKGAARGIAQSAREIGHVPELAEPLASGDFGTSTIRALTRTALAVKGTDHDLAGTLTATLDLAAKEGVGEANKQVRILEETLDPGRTERLLEQQRSRSFLRMRSCESGMYRLEALLDPERATIFKATLDQTVAAWLRARQYDDAEAVGEEFATVEQLQAQALVRFAEVFTAADAKQRGAQFSPGTIYHAPLDPAEDAGLAETVYGDFLPRSVLTSLEDNAAHLLHYDPDGQPVLLDGQKLDENPEARLASPAQRTALGWRDRTCRYPGCDRPQTWALHAHHVVPYTFDRATIMHNLIMYCAEHHNLTHHPEQ